MAEAVPATMFRGRMLLLPFASRVGAAAWRRGGALSIAVDSDKPVDFAALAADPDFDGATLAPLTGGAVITLPLAAERNAWVRRVPRGWAVVLDRVDDRDTPMPVRRDGEMSRIDAAVAARVIAVPGPVPGMELLAGLVRADRQNIPIERRATGFRIRPSLLGVVVERLADDLEFRATETGFLLDGDPGAVPGPAAPGLEPGATDGFSRVLRIPSVPLPELYRRYRAALARAAAVPVPDRHDARIDAAEAALGLGLDRESAILVRAADEDAPSRRDDPRDALLRAAAAALAGEDATAATAPIADMPSGRTDEASLWRGLVLSRDPGHARDAARLLADHVELIRSYPAPLRRRLSDAVALPIARGGLADPRSVLSRLDDTGRVALAGILATPPGSAAATSSTTKTGASASAPAADPLLALDRLSHDPDPLVATEALRAAVDRRVASGALPAYAAAARLDGQLLTARMGGRELPTLLRVATLHAEAAAWPAAFAALREARAGFPDATAAVRPAAATVVAIMTKAIDTGSAASGPTAFGPTAPGKAAPGKAVSGEVASGAAALAMLPVVEDGMDLFPDDDARTALVRPLAERLRGLDLPDRAAGLLHRALAATRDGPDRADLGSRLAATELDRGHADAARAALDDTETAGIASEVSARRAELRSALLALPAAVNAAAPAGASAALSVATSAAGPSQPLAVPPDAAAASGEADALRAAFAARPPPPGRLDAAAERQLLRFAAALARARRADELSDLGRHWIDRFADAGRRNMFRLLTAPAIGSLDDLDRSARDIAAARDAVSELVRDRSGGG
ncbi:MAG: hypothetical protein INR65_07380 [Gluconacetobacter diazotrophicus]|nr:hypothetical protein [Gluconacetobacter diazotrophicus]